MSLNSPAANDKDKARSKANDANDASSNKTPRPSLLDRDGLRAVLFNCPYYRMRQGTSCGYRREVQLPDQHVGHRASRIAGGLDRVIGFLNTGLGGMSIQLT